MDEQEAHNAISSAHTNRRPIPCILAILHHIGQFVKHIVVICFSVMCSPLSVTLESPHDILTSLGYDLGNCPNWHAVVSHFASKIVKQQTHFQISNCNFLLKLTSLVQKNA